MPDTPQVRFTFQNENVQASTPLLGVSHVLARTTRGPFNEASEVLSTFSQFQAKYGSEIVPDGSISNIEKAFELGSKIRVSRVAGAGDVAFGFASSITLPEQPTDPEEPAVERTPLDLVINFNPTPEDETNIVEFTFQIDTKEAGSAVLDATGYGLNRDWFLRLAVGEGPNNRYVLTQFKDYEEEDSVISMGSVLDQRTLISSSKPDATSTFVDPQSFADFINNVPYLKLNLTSVGGSEISIPNPAQFTNTEDVLGFFRNYPQGVVTSVTVDGTAVTTDAPAYLRINEGNNGGDADATTWEEAYEVIKGENDGYQLIASHVHQHQPTDYLTIHAAIAKDVARYFEIMYYIEVPKYDADGDPKDVEGIISDMQTLVPTIGQSYTNAFFAGGIKYYDNNGARKDCDVLGTVLGLGDASASNYGPWYSFSGLNRGIVTNALGPVMENLGSSTKIEDLQRLAEWYVNLFVIKDTRTQGKRTTLWHGFTSHAINDSNKFISITRLCLYIKKNLRPILESYIEEPNTFSTWKNMYYEGREIMEDLTTREAITRYEWLGDQFATTYDEMSINNEADVRQGKYKLKLKIWDIAPLQDVDVTVIIALDTTTGNIDLSIESVNV